MVESGCTTSLSPSPQHRLLGDIQGQCFPRYNGVAFTTPIDSHFESIASSPKKKVTVILSKRPVELKPEELCCGWAVVPCKCHPEKSTVTRGWGPGSDEGDELPFPRWARKRGVTRDEVRAVERLRVRRQQNRGTQEELIIWEGSAWENRVRDSI